MKCRKASCTSSATGRLSFDTVMEGFCAPLSMSQRQVRLPLTAVVGSKVTLDGSTYAQSTFGPKSRTPGLPPMCLPLSVMLRPGFRFDLSEIPILRYSPTSLIRPYKSKGTSNDAIAESMIWVAFHFQNKKYLLVQSVCRGRIKMLQRQPHATADSVLLQIVVSYAPPTLRALNSA